MPINEQQPEQATPSPSNLGLRWPGDRREPSGAGQSPGLKPTPTPPLQSTIDRSRAEQFESILNRHNLPEGYLDVGGGGWTPDAAPSLMDMLVHELIPQPSEEALNLVHYAPSHQTTAAYTLLVATAITVLHQAEDRLGANATGFVVDDLRNAYHRGAMLLVAEGLRSSGQSPVAENIPIIRRPNEAPRFA